MSRNPKGSYTLIITLLVIAILIASAAAVWLCLKIAALTPANQPEETVQTVPTQTEPVPTETETLPPETTLPEPEHVVSTATIAAMGDLIGHLPVFDTLRQSDGSYDFTTIFKYVNTHISEADYAVINLETTFGGLEKGYSGFPRFNSPDDIAVGVKEAGFDMMLTANNHSYDTGIDGFNRTLEVSRAAGLDTLGTMLSAKEPKYTIKDINGIQIGMICYTYDTSKGTKPYPSLNGIAMTEGSYDIINCFRNTDLETFYEEIGGYLADMKAEGAEATILYIHWGVEYLTYANDTQKAIAQKMCDLGFDVIIGGHPHVVEPMALLESTVDPDHKTVCIYSLGNAISNQRKENMTNYLPTGHTEDGALFTVTFEKYSDGTVYLAETDVIPTWVNMDTRSKKEYNILPLEDALREQWQTDFNLNDYMLTFAQKSYDRTMKIIGEGLESCQTYLAEQKAAREEYYYDLAYNPEKFATEPTQETVTETIEETMEETVAETTAAAA